MQRSEQIGELVSALAKAHLGFKKVKRNAENPYFRSSYADLAQLIEATKQSLCENQLSLIQSPDYSAETGVVTITSFLAHASGQWLSNELKMPLSKGDAQGIGSAITYGRRYAYGALLNIASEEDDDANAAAGKIQQDRKSKSTDKSAGTINPVQLRAFWSACKTGGKTDKQVAEYLASLNLKNLEEMQKTDFDHAIKWALGKEPDLDKQLSASVKTTPITQKDFARLFAAAKHHNVPEDDVRTYGHESFNVAHLNEISREQFGKLLEWVEGQ